MAKETEREEIKEETHELEDEEKDEIEDEEDEDVDDEEIWKKNTPIVLIEFVFYHFWYMHEWEHLEPHSLEE